MDLPRYRVKNRLLLVIFARRPIPVSNSYYIFTFYIILYISNINIVPTSPIRDLSIGDDLIPDENVDIESSRSLVSLPTSEQLGIYILYILYIII